MNRSVWKYRWWWGKLAALAVVVALGLCLLACGGMQSDLGRAEAHAAPTTAAEIGERPSLEEALADLKIPPDWLDAVEMRVASGMTLQEARRRIVQYLESSDPEDPRRAVKLAYRYAERGELTQGHEYAVYLYQGGEYAWALTEFQKKVAPEPEPDSAEYGALVMRYRFLASCYRYFRAYEEAEQALLRALAVLPPPPNRDIAKAAVDSDLAGLYAEMGQKAKAAQHYAKAIAAYRSVPDAGHVVRLLASGAESRANALHAPDLAEAALKDGRHVGTAPAYEGDVRVAVDVDGGRVTGIDVQHQESRQRGSVRVIPSRIVETQSLHVDGVTGATITSDAIVGAASQALRSAGLE